MTPRFLVLTTPRFERLLRALLKRHPQARAVYASAVEILEADPYNRTRQHAIRKLVDVPAGEGQ